MRVVVVLVVLAALIAIFLGLRPHGSVQAQAPSVAVEGVPPITNPQLAREQSYGRRVEYIAARAPALSRAYFGPRIRTAYYAGVGIENGVVTDDGTMYVTQVVTQPQGTMRQFYTLSILSAGRLIPVRLPPPSRNPSFPGYLALDFDGRTHGNSVFVDASDYDGHQFVLAINGANSSVTGLRRTEGLFVNGFGAGSRCMQRSEPGSPYLLWLVDAAGKKSPLLSQAELARATGGILDTTANTNISLTCSYFDGENFINVRDSVAAFVMRLKAAHAAVVSSGFFDVSGKNHARVTRPGANVNGPPAENLEMFSRQ